MEGVARFTFSGSQSLAAAALFASPEYAALQLTVPASVNVNGAEFGTTPFVTVTGLPTTRPVPHVAPTDMK
jgi:hypothetical protein